MRLLVLFDMPVKTKPERREYTKFRDFLLDCGFLMLQYSVYTRIAQNDSDAEKHIRKIQSFQPKYGNIRILKVTDNQYTSMIMVQGEKSEQEVMDSSDDLIVV